MNKFCIDCDESYQVNKDCSSCSICGSTFQTSMLVPSNENTSANVLGTAVANTNNTMENITFDSFMSELIGNVDFRSFEESIRSQANKKLSRQYLSCLGKVIVDPRGVVLYDCYIHIGDSNVSISTHVGSTPSSSVVKITAIPAEFSPLPISNIINDSLNINPAPRSSIKTESPLADTELIISDPIYGGDEVITVSNTNNSTISSISNCNSNNNAQSIKLLSNTEDCKNKMVIMSRGGNISFVTKAKIAQLSGASCLIVTQTYDIWPFVMTDKSNEIVYEGLIENDSNSNTNDNTNSNTAAHDVSNNDSGETRINNDSKFKLNIPVVMISKDDSIQLQKLMSSCKHPLKASLYIGEQITQCAICCDTMMPTTMTPLQSHGVTSITVGTTSSISSETPAILSLPQQSLSSSSSSTNTTSEVLKLPCRHVFHSACIHSWLENHNSCPMCRYNMLLDTNGEIRADSSNSTAGGGGSVTSQLNRNQPYFI